MVKGHNSAHVKVMFGKLYCPAKEHKVNHRKGGKNSVMLQGNASVLPAAKDTCRDTSNH